MLKCLGSNNSVICEACMLHQTLKLYECGLHISFSRQMDAMYRTMMEARRCTVLLLNRQLTYLVKEVRRYV